MMMMMMMLSHLHPSSIQSGQMSFTNLVNLGNTAHSAIWKHEIFSVLFSPTSAFPLKKKRLNGWLKMRIVSSPSIPSWPFWGMMLSHHNLRYPGPHTSRLATEKLRAAVETLRSQTCHEKRRWDMESRVGVFSPPKKNGERNGQFLSNKPVDLGPFHPILSRL